MFIYDHYIFSTVLVTCSYSRASQRPFRLHICNSTLQKNADIYAIHIHNNIKKLMISCNICQCCRSHLWFLLFQCHSGIALVERKVKSTWKSWMFHLHSGFNGVGNAFAKGTGTADNGRTVREAP